MDCDLLNQAQRTRQLGRAAGERALWLLRGRGAVEVYGMPRHVEAVLKAAVAGASTADTSALAALRGQSEALVAPTSAGGFFDAIRADAVPGDFHVSYAVAISRLTAAAHLEGRAAPVTRFNVARRMLREQQALAILVVSRELQRFASAPAMLEMMLREGIARATDDMFVAQLVAGAPSIAASGSDSVAIAFDLRRALQSINSGSDARFHVAVGVDLAKLLAMLVDDVGQFVFPAMSPTGGFLSGGRGAGIPAHVTESLTDDVVVVDARGIIAASGEVGIDMASQASLEMDTEPTNATNDGGSPAAPVEQQMVSLFQTDSAALRVRRTFDWTALRTAHTCVITGAGASWGLNTTTSPPT